MVGILHQSRGGTSSISPAVERRTSCRSLCMVVNVCVCVSSVGTDWGTEWWPGSFFVWLLCTPYVHLVLSLYVFWKHPWVRILLGSSTHVFVCVFFPNSDELRAKDLVMMGYSYSFWFSLVSFFWIELNSFSLVAHDVSMHKTSVPQVWTWTPRGRLRSGRRAETMETWPPNLMASKSHSDDIVYIATISFLLYTRCYWWLPT